MEGSKHQKFIDTCESSGNSFGCWSSSQIIFPSFFAIFNRSAMAERFPFAIHLANAPVYSSIIGQCFQQFITDDGIQFCHSHPW